MLGVDLDPALREELMADRMQRMRERPEAEREQVAAQDLRRG